MSFEDARHVADAVLYEGYLLYPYRASHGKNQARVRWQFGVLVPRPHAEANPIPSASATISGAAETWYSATECIVEAKEHASIELKLRCLQVQSRVVEALGPDGNYTAVESLPVDGSPVVSWDEGVEHEFHCAFSLEKLCAGEQGLAYELPATTETETLAAADSAEVGRVVRARQEVSLRLTVSAEELEGPYGIARLRVVVGNVTDWAGPGIGRGEVLQHSSVATHVILGVENGTFLSLLDPPEWARPAVAACTSEHTWPVLVGSANKDTILSSPMVLPDFPEIAPESPMDLFDGTENDELLSLRIMTLTEEEKAEARATDPRAAAILDQVDNLPPEIYERLHGAIRSMEVGGRMVKGPAPTGGGSAGSLGSDFPEMWTDADGTVKESPVAGTAEGVPWWDPGADASVNPDTDTVPVQGVTLSKGSRVRLRPGQGGRSDAQDMFLEDRLAEVAGVYFDIDDEPYLAVTLEDDPGADIARWHGRFLYFKPWELEPLDAPEGETASASERES